MTTQPFPSQSPALPDQPDAPTQTQRLDPAKLADRAMPRDGSRPGGTMGYDELDAVDKMSRDDNALRPQMGRTGNDGLGGALDTPSWSDNSPDRRPAVHAALQIKRLDQAWSTVVSTVADARAARDAARAVPAEQRRQEAAHDRAVSDAARTGKEPPTAVPVDWPARARELTATAQGKAHRARDARAAYNQLWEELSSDADAQRERVTKAVLSARADLASALEQAEQALATLADAWSAASTLPSQDEDIALHPHQRMPQKAGQHLAAASAALASLDPDRPIFVTGRGTALSLRERRQWADAANSGDQRARHELAQLERHEGYAVSAFSKHWGQLGPKPADVRDLARLHRAEQQRQS
ncbi:hypothetical protein [Serinicoccus kebangsaanensis]|uniref:hypothetical protein n=1 Tax=Serinicoccus kebangsaanensis TaxID=2602069 RepID=UPI00124DE0A3|nr:hypothetical protein [Serinicoccus kebangsaanensis]